jgi:hypothetical protein
MHFFSTIYCVLNASPLGVSLCDSAYDRHHPWCVEPGFYKLKWVFLLQVASSRTPWSCASHHHVRFQIPCVAVETQTSRNTKKCKMKPCSRCSYEERNIFNFLFLWWIRCSCNHAHTLPSFSYLTPSFPPILNCADGTSYCDYQSLLLSWPCHCQASCWYKNFPDH